jgi:hypothetical protein
MNDFLYLFRGGASERSALSPEVMQEHMSKWQSWMGQLAHEGKLKDGLPLNTSGSTVKKGGIVTDGPFSEGKEFVGGYLIVKAADLKDACTIAKGCPIFEHDGTVEVRQIMPM